MSKDNWFEVIDVQVWGGAGSVAANAEDLERAAQRQTQAQEYLRQVNALLFNALESLEQEWLLAQFNAKNSAASSSGLGPVFPSFEQYELRHTIDEETHRIATDLVGLQNECSDLGAQVFKSAQDYSRAEADAGKWWHRMFTGSETGPSFLLGGNPILALTMKFNAGFTAPHSHSFAERSVSGFAAFMNPFGVPDGETNVSFFAQNAGPVLSGGFNFGLMLQRIDATKWQLEPGQLAQHTVAARPANNVEDVVSTVVANRNDHDGQIMVQQQTAPDGTKSWVIYVPGTQEWDLNGQSHPIDASGNLDLMSGSDSALPMEYLRAAIQQAGIGPDEPVTFMGHSQGGIVVQQAQTDPWIAEHVNLKSVVTVASPVSLHAANPAVKTLHIENNRDFVPALDGRNNPDSTNRVTVHATITDDGKQHSVEQNMAILQAPAVKTDPSVQGILGDINAHVGVAPGGATVTTFYEAKKKA